MKVMVTGHRPARLGDKATSAAVWLDEQLRELKPNIAISGMAAGADQIFAELALKQHISLVAAGDIISQSMRENDDSVGKLEIDMVN